MPNTLAMFDNLDADTLDRIRAISSIKRFPKDSVVIETGEHSDAMYGILDGRLQAVIINDQGKQIVLNVFGPGDLFGEMSFVDGDARSATIVTKTTARLVVIPRKRFKDIISANPAILWSFVSGLIKKLRKATRQIEDLAFFDVYGRIARLLTDLAGEAGTIRERLTHQEIADRVGASREMVSRVIKALIDRGYLHTDARRRIQVIDLPYKLDLGHPPSNG